MTETKLGSYKGYDLFVNDEGKFRGRDEAHNHVAESKTLEGLKKLLNDRRKATGYGQKVLLRKSSWHGDDWGDFTEEKVKSSVQRGKSIEYELERVWGGHPANDLLKDTPQNREKLAKLSELGKQSAKLDNERDKAIDSLERWTDDELLAPATSSGGSE